VVTVTVEFAVSAVSHRVRAALESEGVPSLSVTAGNAAALLAAFGLPVEPDGSVDPDRILTHAVTARQIASETPPTLVATPTGPTSVRLLEERVEALVEIAEVAARLRLPVTWG